MRSIWIVTLFLASTAGATEFVVPRILIDSHTVLYINSSILPSQEAYPLNGGAWVLLSKAGPLIWHPDLEGIGFKRLTPTNTDYFRITSWAKVEDRIFLATARAGIYFVDPKSLEVRGSQRLGEVQSFATGTNLELTQESDGEDIWASTFLELHKFDVKTRAWLSLTKKFSELGLGEGSSRSLVLPDSGLVWINGPAHTGSKGGLLRYSLTDDHWAVFRAELEVAESGPQRIDHLDLLATPHSLWVFHYEGNLYNFFLSRFDKPSGKWRTAWRGDIASLIDKLIDELPGARWVRSRPIVSSLDYIVRDAGSLPSNHPYKFGANELARLTQAVKRLDDAFLRNDPHAEVTRGIERYSVQNGQLIRGRAYAAGEPLQKIDFSEVTYQMLLSEFDGSLLVQTDRGLGTLNINEGRLALFEPAISLTSQAGIDVSFSRGRLNICEYFPGEDGPDTSKKYLIDLKRRKTLESKTVIGGSCPNSQNRERRKIAVGPISAHLEWDGILIDASQNGERSNKALQLPPADQRSVQ